MNKPARVRNVENLGDRQLRVTFTDGLVRELDFDGVLHGLLTSVDTDQAFGQAAVDPVTATVTWPGGIDLDPDVLHSDWPAVSAIRPRPVREYQLEATN